LHGAQVARASALRARSRPPFVGPSVKRHPASSTLLFLVLRLRLGRLVVPASSIILLFALSSWHRIGCRRRRGCGGDGRQLSCGSSGQPRADARSSSPSRCNAGPRHPGILVGAVLRRGGHGRAAGGAPRAPGRTSCRRATARRGCPRAGAPAPRPQSLSPAEPRARRPRCATAARRHGDRAKRPTRPAPTTSGAACCRPSSPRRWRSPELCSRGTRPRYAATWPGRANRVTSSSVATNATAVTGPTPGVVASRRATAMARSVARAI
jgi:hypothetical protein